MEYNYEQHIDSIGEIADRINLDKITILTGRNASKKLSKKSTKTKCYAENDKY